MYAIDSIYGALACVRALITNLISNSKLLSWAFVVWLPSFSEALCKFVFFLILLIFSSPAYTTG